mgnify:CR=1 FL=1|tara:strand:- start:509 stop:982 length:474 start_codon:yes stop_codon:yes gene_type:complete
MVCGYTCGIAIIFLIANLYTILSCSIDNNKNNFLNVLDDNQKKIYKNIINERKNIYFGGFIFGIILSIITIFLIKKTSLKSKFNNISVVCLVGTITFITNYLFYILYPKTDYMLMHLNDKRQIKEWLIIYKNMQYKFHIGFVLGIIAIMIFSYAFRC